MDNCKINIIKLVKSDLIDKDIFKRTDNDGSTEFTYTRFFVPYLNNYSGYAIFVDSDFLWDCDVLELFEKYVNSTCAVSCVKHKYTQCNDKFKMDGKKQEWYPKKNWSSLMIYKSSPIKGLIKFYLQLKDLATSLSPFTRGWHDVVISPFSPPPKESWRDPLRLVGCKYTVSDYQAIHFLVFFLKRLKH